MGFGTLNYMYRTLNYSYQELDVFFYLLTLILSYTTGIGNIEENYWIALKHV